MPYTLIGMTASTIGSGACIFLGSFCLIGGASVTFLDFGLSIFNGRQTPHTFTLIGATICSSLFFFTIGGMLGGISIGLFASKLLR